MPKIKSRMLGKVLSAVLLFCASAAPAGIVDKLGPASSTAEVTIAKVAKQRNCLTHLSAASNTIGASLMVLDVGTTIYAVELDSATPFTDTWSQADPLCTSFVSSTTIKVTAGSNYTINYQGVRIDH